MSGAVRLDFADRVARLTIDRPARRNALTSGMFAALLDGLDALDRPAGPAVAAVVLTGAGGAFSAGADLGELRDPARRDHLREIGERAVLRLRELRVPTFALVDGPCLGAACSLALACDVRLCSPAALFAVPALRNRVVYERAHVRRLVQVVGPGPAGLLLLGGERWTGVQAAGYGLADRCAVDPGAELDRLLAGLRDAPAPVLAATTAALRSAARD